MDLNDLIEAVRAARIRTGDSIATRVRDDGTVQVVTVARGPNNQAFVRPTTDHASIESAVAELNKLPVEQS